MTDQDWLHLKPFGYAPGNYMNRCHRCQQVVEGVDKRAVTCRPCAESARATRIEELTRALTYANHMGVRAELVGDAEQKAEMARVFREAKAELAALDAARGAA